MKESAAVTKAEVCLPMEMTVGCGELDFLSTIAGGGGGWWKFLTFLLGFSSLLLMPNIYSAFLPGELVEHLNPKQLR